MDNIFHASDTLEPPCLNSFLEETLLDYLFKIFYLVCKYNLSSAKQGLHELARC
jgi:hypothetical protein